MMCVTCCKSAFANGTQSQIAHEKEPEKRRWRRMTKILVVEDNEMNRDMLTRRLQKRGYEVGTAADGEEALTMASSECPDLILMDLSLPLVDGWEVTRRIKQTPEIAAIPIIAITAHAMRGDREKALEAGCDDYETKPIDFHRLLGKIKALLNK